MSSWHIISQIILPLTALVGVAFGYQKIFKVDTQQLNNLVLYLLLPINIFHELSIKRIGLGELWKPLLFMLLLTAALTGLAWLAAKLLRLTPEQRVSFILSIAMINVGNLGLSLIFFTYGPDANQSALLIFIAFNIPLTTLAIYFSSNQKTRRGALRDMLKIPIFHATLLALLLNSLGTTIPAPVHTITGYLGQATFPIFTLVFGMQLASVRFTKSLFSAVAIASVLRLVVSPLVAVICLGLVGISGLGYKVALVQTSTPAPILPLMYAIRFNRSPELLAAIIIATTLLSVLTLPLVIAFAN